MHPLLVLADTVARSARPAQSARPSADDGAGFVLGLCLALPLGVLLGLWLGRKLRGGAARRARRRAAPPAAPAHPLPVAQPVEPIEPGPRGETDHQRYVRLRSQRDQLRNDFSDAATARYQALEQELRRLWRRLSAADRYNLEVSEGEWWKESS